jgi:hypothetical protein
MKAISFLEYFKNTNLRDVLNKELFNYHEKVSQPFSFEKVVELFEGFEIDKYKALDLLEHDKFWMCIDESGLHIWIKRTVHPDYSTITPKTIDEFITLCNNLNVELQWKQ